MAQALLIFLQLLQLMRVQHNYLKYKQSAEKNPNRRNSIQNSKSKKPQDAHLQKAKGDALRDNETPKNSKNYTLVNQLQNIQGDLKTITKNYCGRIIKNKINRQELLVDKNQPSFHLNNKITNIPEKQRSETPIGAQTSQKFITKFMSNQKKFKHFVQREKSKSTKKFEKSFMRTCSLSAKKIQGKNIQQLCLEKTFEGTIIKNIPKTLPLNEQRFFTNSLESKYLNFKILEAIKTAQTIPLPKRTFKFSMLTVPSIPQPPVYNCSLESLMESILKVLPLGEIQISRDQFAGCSLKKYRNCIVFSLPNNDRLRLVWHFNGKLYIGEWNKQTNEKVGLGMQIIPKKQYYKGEFSSGKKYGKGIFVKSDGTIYEGDFINGLKHGKGKYLNSKEDCYYEGEWNNDKMFNYGFLQIVDNIFQGTFKSDLKQGFGVETFQNGDKYIGNYLQDKFHGQGKYVWSKGSFYLGHFKYGNRQGFGKWISQEQQGQTYVGFYTDDKKHGTGKYIWKNGCVYQGNFQMDIKEGMGCLQYPDGRIVQGIWKDNQLTKVISKSNDAHMNKPLQIKNFSKEKKNKKIIDRNQV